MKKNSCTSCGAPGLYMDKGTLSVPFVYRHLFQNLVMFQIEEQKLVLVEIFSVY